MLDRGTDGFTCIEFMRTSLFLFLIITLAGCFRPPEFSNEPQIALERLKLTDDAKLIITFKVRDGDGDIGLNNEADYDFGEFPEDLQAPFHQNNWIIDDNDQVVTISSENLQGPFRSIPAARYLQPVCLAKSNATSPPNCQSVSGIIGYIDFLPFYDRAGDEEFLSNSDPRPPSYDCEFYEIVPRYDIETDSFTIPGEQGTFVNQSVEIVGRDTVLVERNPFFYNLYIDIEVKDGNAYVPIQEFFDVIEPCDPIYTSRFPVFDRSDFGRPLDGSIEYEISSGQFLDGPILQETIRFRFYIYDRALNKSNEVLTQDFRILDLRSGDLIGS